jgi:hypothetical protein
MDYETAQDLFDALSMPFPSEMIDWRIGSTNKDKTQGMALAYVDARAVMDRLDHVCGFDGWQCNYTPGVNGSIVCNLGIRTLRAFPMPPVTGAPTHDQWVWKADGAGATDFEGEKGALSDAFKRAAVRHGIGRYLYDLKAPWVPIENGKFIPEAEKKKLMEVHDDFANKAGWGLRAGVQAYKLLNQAIKEFVTDAASAQEFREKNKGMIPQLPVAMRRHLLETLDRIGGSQQEAAE